MKILLPLCILSTIYAVYSVIDCYIAIGNLEREIATLEQNQQTYNQLINK